MNQSGQIFRQECASAVLGLFVLSWAWTSLGCSPLNAITCPASVSVTQQTSATPESWSVSYDKAAHLLQSITLYEGPIQEGSSLVFDEQNRKGTDLVAIWRLDPKSPKGYWLACSYDLTSVILSRPLPHEMSLCTVTYTTDQKYPSGLPVIKGMECR